MPTKPEEKAPENNGEGQESSIDPQKKYLMDQFGNLMEKVGDGFGGISFIKSQKSTCWYYTYR